MSEEIVPREVHVLEPAYNKMYEIARRAVPKEAGGFLVGFVARWGDEYHVVVTDVIEVEYTSTEINVQLLSRGAARFAQELSRYRSMGLYIIGWFHSHPGYHPAPSVVDIRSHVTYFREPYQVGIIVDPVHGELGAFSCTGEPCSGDNLKFFPIYVWRSRDVDIVERLKKASSAPVSENSFARVYDIAPPMPPRFTLVAGPFHPEQNVAPYAEKFGHRQWDITRSYRAIVRDRVLLAVFFAAVFTAVFAILLLLLG